MPRKVGEYSVYKGVINMKDLTKGSPVKIILLFALPIICGNIFQQLYNIADSKIVSTYVSTNAFAAVGATSVVSNTIIGFINGLTQGFAIPIANSFGARDEKRMRRFVSGTIILSMSVAVILTIASLMFIEPILVVLKTPEDILPQALTYVRIILAGIIFTALYNMCANVLRAVGDSKTPLYCLVTSVIFNIGLDLLFVRTFDMKIEGAAYATVISQAIAAIMCIVYILFKFRSLLPKKDEWKTERGQYPDLITTGLSMGLMSCIVNIGTVVLQGAINGLGTAIVAAHTAARRVFDILTVTLFSIGIAMTTFVSQNMGAERPDRARQGVRQAIGLVTIITTALVVICFVFGRPVFVWLTNSTDSEIIEPAVMYSRISIVFFYVLGPLFVLRCSLQGMGRKIIPVCSSVLEMIIKILSAQFLVPVFAYRGVAFTEPISWVAMTILLSVSYVIIVRGYKVCPIDKRETINL